MRHNQCQLNDEWNEEPAYPKWIQDRSIEFILLEEYDLKDSLTLSFIEDERLTVEKILKYAKEKEEWESKYGERDPDF